MAAITKRQPVSVAVANNVNRQAYIQKSQYSCKKRRDMYHRHPYFKPMKKKNTQNPGNWQLATRLVRGGRLKTPFNETSEALFLNSSYSYDSAEDGEALFAGKRDGFKYGRYSHPNLAMLE